MDLNALLTNKGIDPETVLVLRHPPHEPQLRRVLPWLAAEKPDLYNAYQQTQTPRVEQAMARSTYVASFIWCERGKAASVGLYSVGSSRPLTFEQFWDVPANRTLKEFGMDGFTRADGRSTILWFDLVPTDFYPEWLAGDRTLMVATGAPEHFSDSCDPPTGCARRGDAQLGSAGRQLEGSRRLADRVAGRAEGVAGRLFDFRQTRRERDTLGRRTAATISSVAGGIMLRPATAGTNCCEAVTPTTSSSASLSASRRTWRPTT